MSSLIQSSGLTGFAVPGASLVASVASNALTVALKTAAGNDPSPASPLFAAFPSGSSATYVGKIITTPLSAGASSGSTLGASSGKAFRVWVLLFDNGDGTFALALKNCSTASGIFPLAEYGTGSTTAEGGAGAADSAGVAYSTSAVSAKPFRIVGFLEWSAGLTTAGTWGSAPDIIQLFGPGCKKPGDMIQKMISISFARVDGNTVIPRDDSIPQSNEGDQYFANSITPTSTANLIENRLTLNGATTSEDVVAACLFQDSNTDATCVSWERPVEAQKPVQLILEHIQLAATVSATTFKIRAGYSSAFATAFALNGSALTCHFFGQRVQSSFITTEYMG